MIWSLLLFLQYSIICIGLLSNLFFIRLIVFNKLFNLYTRTLLFFISLGMLLLLISYLIIITTCLNTTLIYEAENCGKGTIQFKIGTSLRLYAQIMYIVSLFFFSLDRIIFICAPGFHSRITYLCLCILSLIIANYISYLYTFTAENGKPRNSWVIFLNGMIVFTFVLELITNYLLNRTYSATIGALSLSQRYELSMSLQTVRSIVPASFLILFIQVSLYVFMWVSSKTQFISTIKTFSIYNFIFNTETIIFPWIVLMNNIYTRRKIAKTIKHFTKITLFNIQSGDATMNNNLKQTTYNGRNLVHFPTQNDYFEQLRNAW